MKNYQFTHEGIVVFGDAGEKLRVIVGLKEAVEELEDLCAMNQFLVSRLDKKILEHQNLRAIEKSHQTLVGRLQEENKRLHLSLLKAGAPNGT